MLNVILHTAIKRCVCILVTFVIKYLLCFVAIEENSHNDGIMHFHSDFVLEYVLEIL